MHPVDQFGDPIYSKAVACRERGCILDSSNQYRETKVFQATKGIAPSQQTFDNYSPISGTELAFRYARDWASGRADWIWLLLFGTTGNGKSHLCNAAAREIVRRGHDVKVTTAANMLSSLRKAIKGEGMDRALDEFKDVDYLIVDDFGIEQGTEWERSTIDDLMVTRYEQLKCTMVTTNLEPTHLPERMRSRFEDRERARVAHNAAPDYRRVKQ